jgi:hypothetical protein
MKKCTYPASLMFEGKELEEGEIEDCYPKEFDRLLEDDFDDLEDLEERIEEDENHF